MLASLPIHHPPTTHTGYSYCSRAMRKSVPKHHFPDAPLPANVVKTLIEDEMILDGHPRQV